MQSVKKHTPLVLINLALFMILLLLRDTDTLTLRIYGIAPMLPLCLLVCFSMFSSELSAFFTALLVGVVLDGVADTPTGFNAICFMLIGVFVSLMANHIFNKNLSAAVALCLICSLFYFLLRWAFCDMTSLNFYDNLRFVLRYVLPKSIYTTAFTFAFYFIEKALFKKYN